MHIKWDRHNIVIHWRPKIIIQQSHNETEFNFCEYCNDEIRDNEEGTYIDNYGYVCDYCLGEHFTYCDDCCEWFHNEKITHIENSNTDVCDRCLETGDYYYCENCGNYFHIDDVQYAEDGSCFCHDCYSDKYTECRECSKEIEICEAEEYVGDLFCSECCSNLIELARAV